MFKMSKADKKLFLAGFHKNNADYILDGAKWSKYCKYDQITNRPSTLTFSYRSGKVAVDYKYFDSKPQTFEHLTKCEWKAVYYKVKDILKNEKKAQKKHSIL